MKNYGDLRPRRVKPSSLLDLHNSSQDTQPHSLIVMNKYFVILYPHGPSKGNKVKDPN